jgi:hypothetical protein
MECFSRSYFRAVQVLGMVYRNPNAILQMKKLDTETLKGVIPGAAMSLQSRRAQGSN